MQLTISLSHDFSDLTEAAEFVALAKAHFSKWFEAGPAVPAPAPRREVPMDRPPVLVADAPVDNASTAFGRDMQALEAPEMMAPASVPTPAKRGRKPRAQSESVNVVPATHDVFNPTPNAAPVAHVATMPVASVAAATPAPTPKLPIGNAAFEALNSALAELISNPAGHAEALRIFGEYKAARLSQLPAEKYAEVTAKIDAATAALALTS